MTSTSTPKNRHASPSQAKAVRQVRLDGTIP